MNDIENRLRDAYRGASDTVRPDAIRGLREHATEVSPSARWWARGGLHRLMVPLTAAAAVALIGVLAAVVVPGALHGGRHQGGKTTAPIAGNPATHFLVGLAADGEPSYLSVRSAITGAAVATIAAPQGRFFGPAATADGISYVVAVKKPGNCGTWLYRFTISRTGQPSRLTPFRPGYWRSHAIVDLTISRNGRTFAFAGLQCSRPGGKVHVVAYRAVLGVVATRVISKASYSDRGTFWPVPGHGVVNSLSLTADGRQLEYSTDSAIYVLPTDAALSGNAVRRSRVIVDAARFGASTAISDTAMTPDGKTVYFTTYEAGRAFNGRWVLRVVDVASGRSRLITGRPGGSVHIVASPSGHELIAFVQAARTPVVTPSPVPTGTQSPSPTVTPSPIPSWSPSPSLFPTVTPSPSPTGSRSPFPTVTPSPSPTRSRSPRPTVTPSPSPSRSPAIAPLNSATLDAAFEPSEVIRIQLPGGRIRYLNPARWDVPGLFYIW